MKRTISGLGKKSYTNFMQQKGFEDETFNKIDFTTKTLSKGEYDNCTFNHCNFEKQDLSGFLFIDCAFYDCNLSLVLLGGTVLRDIKFRDCKMLGLRFDHCSDFGLSFSFEGCNLAHSSFYKKSIKKTVFKKTDLQEADLSFCDLTGATFDECNLASTLFDNTVLEKADLRTAHNYSIDPETNRIKGAKFSSSGLPGLLGKYKIHIEG